MRAIFAQKERTNIAFNVEVHNQLAEKYDELHVEIFNPTEQARLGKMIEKAFGYVATRDTHRVLLDFGSGTGNLVMHMWKLGVEVVAADVSERSLQRLMGKIGDAERLKTLVLNGRDLSSIADKSFDMVATYSVLHHVPDYLKVIDEFARVVKPGGIIYLDHEVCPSYWEPSEVYNTYLSDLGDNFLNVHLYELGVTVSVNKTMFGSLVSSAGHLINMLLRQLRHTVVSDFGDIHVFKHDHIEWNKIVERLASSCDIVANEDYLVCREQTANPLVWQKWSSKCVDMRVMIFRKRNT